MAIYPKVGVLVNFTDEDGKIHKGSQVIAKEKGFAPSGEEKTLYVVSDEHNKKHRLLPEEMEYYRFREGGR